MKNVQQKITLVIILICFQFGFSQYKYEREHRILKSQFPARAIAIIENKIQDFKRIKFYKEIDSSITNYAAKLKKDKLWYKIEFDKDGTLKAIEIRINPVDIPNDTYSKINEYLNKNFKKHRVKELKQYYSSYNDSLEETFKNAFQNLILPSNNYKIIVAGKLDKVNIDYEVLFDADGNFKKMKPSLPANYDHVLY